jgi:glycosyltransferase involved in cell wall biosynthesis
MHNNKLIVNQFTPAIAIGDGVSKGLIFTQQLLISLGYCSNIYANHIENDLLEKVIHIDEYEEHHNNILIYHLSIGHEHHQRIMEYSDKKILAYHNITPPHFFNTQPHLKSACEQGREQLVDACQYMLASYSDSPYNNKELLSLNYVSPQVLPLLVNIEDVSRESEERRPSPFSTNSFNIIFVGRIVSNKCQHQLIDTLLQLKILAPIKPVRLHLIGSISEPEYREFIDKYIRNLDLSEEVIVHGKVFNEKLSAMYQHADLFLSLSEHEGFCMPALEAICNKLPVLAYNCGGISSVVKKKTLLQYKSADKVAKKIEEYISNPHKLKALNEEQKSYLSIFERNTLASQLSSLIEEVAVDCINDNIDLNHRPITR